MNNISFSCEIRNLQKYIFNSLQILDLILFTLNNFKSIYSDLKENLLQKYILWI